ncbi:MAG: 3-hydroxyacyl-CoA dehydrogenase NAD-binding domain-containing protein [Pseudomonadota bacterium]
MGVVKIAGKILMSKVSIIGLGHIGMNILQTFAQANIDVLGIEIDKKIIERGLERSKKNLESLVKKEKISPERRDEILSKMKVSDDIFGIKDSQCVIEAIFEDINQKKELFKQINKIVSRECLVLSNTSSLSITEMATVVDNPGRFAGMHFFNPVPIMKLVEVVRGLQTSDETVAATKELAKAIGKVPIMCKDSPAFVVNRMLNALTKEAILILEEGIASAEDIDTGAKLGLGHPMGPLELFDYLSAIHLLEKVLQYMSEELDPRFKPPRLLKNMVRAGWWGREYGRGFYQYKEGEE